jgi:hypothetical protein
VGQIRELLPESDWTAMSGNLTVSDHGNRTLNRRILRLRFGTRRGDLGPRPLSDFPVLATGLAFLSIQVL